MIIRCTERDYRVREDNGTVTVCLQKDVDTLEDLMLNVAAGNCDPPDALGRGANTFTAKIEWLIYYCLKMDYYMASDTAILKI